MIIENNTRSGLIIIARKCYTVLPAQEFLRKKWKIDVGFVPVETYDADAHGNVPPRHADKIAELQYLMPRKFCAECGFDYQTEGL